MESMVMGPNLKLCVSERGGCMEMLETYCREATIVEAACSCKRSPSVGCERASGKRGFLRGCHKITPLGGLGKIQRSGNHHTCEMEFWRCVGNPVKSPDGGGSTASALFSANPLSCPRVQRFPRNTNPSEPVKRRNGFFFLPAIPSYP